MNSTPFTKRSREVTLLISRVIRESCSKLARRLNLNSVQVCEEALEEASTMTNVKGQLRLMALRNDPKISAGLKIGSAVISFQPDELDDVFIEKARKELRETPEVVAQALAEIRELVKGEPDLYVPDDDDHYKKFLRPCKWYTKPAFNLMKRFYSYIRTHPRYCADLHPTNERALILSGIITPLPHRGKDATRILLIECGKKWKPKEISLEQIFRGVMLILYAAMCEPKSQVGGCRVILDMEGLSLNQVTYFTPSFAAAVLEWVQKCLPARLKGVHIVNQPYVFNMVFAIFKPFIQEKLRNRIHFHGTDRATLLAVFGSKALPTRFGGEFDLPWEPVGEPMFQYLSYFTAAFEEANSYGYVNKT